jgi:hypothetical protein
LLSIVKSDGIVARLETRNTITDSEFKKPMMRNFFGDRKSTG